MIFFCVTMMASVDFIGGTCMLNLHHASNTVMFYFLERSFTSVHESSTYCIQTLTLKMPRKPASENVVCLCCLLNIFANFSNLFLHTGKQCGPDQTAHTGV